MPGYLTNDFYLYDPTDQTKQLTFDVSALTTSTLRVLVIQGFGAATSNTIAALEAPNIFTAPNRFNDLVDVFADATTNTTLFCLTNGTGGTPLFAAQFSSGQTAPLTRWTASNLSTNLLVVNYRGNFTDDLFAVCDDGDPTKRVFFQCSGITTATDRTLTVPDASGTIALTSAIPTGGLASGTYAPTRSAEANLDANVTPSSAQYLRVGNTVTVSGRVTGVDPTAPGAASFELTLPVASNIGAVEDCAGVAFCSAIAGQGAAITGSVANNTAVFSWTAVDVTSQSWSYTYSFEVI